MNNKVYRIRLSCEVPGYYKEVMDAFDRKLFEALAPAYPPMEVERFTGSKTGDEVTLTFKGPLPMKWVSMITDHGSDSEKAFFIDRGVVLPFGLTYWKHHHIVEKIDAHHSRIIDDMFFSGKNKWRGALLYPALYLAFSARKPKYLKYFRSKR
jgi:ligand-binding SRPBCC domain-containing protein